MISSNLPCALHLKDYIRTTQMLIGLETPDMIRMTQKHFFQQWDAAQQTVGMLMDLAS